MTAAFRIATLNLENLHERLGPGAFDDRIAILRPQLQRLRADILCLQEVHATFRKGEQKARDLVALDRLLEHTEYEHFHRVTSLNRKAVQPADRHNLVVLSRFPIRDHRQIWHDLVTPPLHHPVAAPNQCEPVEWDRPLLHVRLDLGDGHVVNVVNVHLRAPRAAFVAGAKKGQVWSSVGGWAEGFFLASLKRSGQALEARLLIEQIFDAEPGALIAVCGDFNADDREMPVRAIRGDEEDTGNGHLAGRVLIPLDRSIPQSSRYSVVHHGQRVMLDHILVSRPLMGWVRACEIHNESLGDELVSPLLVADSPETYHAPVVADFAAPPI